MNDSINNQLIRVNSELDNSRLTRCVYMEHCISIERECVPVNVAAVTLCIFVSIFVPLQARHCSDLQHTCNESCKKKFNTDCAHQQTYSFNFRNYKIDMT